LANAGDKLKCVGQ